MLHNTGQSLVFRVDKDTKQHVNISGGPLGLLSYQSITTSIFILVVPLQLTDINLRKFTFITGQRIIKDQSIRSTVTLFQEKYVSLVIHNVSCKLFQLSSPSINVNNIVAYVSACQYRCLTLYDFLIKNSPQNFRLFFLSLVKHSRVEKSAEILGKKNIFQLCWNTQRAKRWNFHL